MNGIQDNTLLQDLVHDTIRRWRSGEAPDADALLKRHPELAVNKSLAIDLIYEEFCLRSEQGDTLVPSTFCERFPHFEQSLSKMLAVHETLEESSARRQHDSAHGVRPPARSPWPCVGDSFLGYELVEALGRGSLARVFLAREAAVGQRYVVVKISRHGAGEAQMLGKAVHPAIVPILSLTLDQSTGWTIICMPFLGTATCTNLLKVAFAEGGKPTTAAIIAQVAAQTRPATATPERIAQPSPLPWRGPYIEGIARLGLLLAEGLAAAHNVGVMHRDIKPSNVLLASSGRPMLLDFNLSTEIGLPGQRVAGTLAYMAPELMEAMTAQGGLAREFDPRADLFSLGALLYELLTGRLPAKPASAEQLAPGDAGPWLAARRQGVPFPRLINPQIDACLESIVLRCLACDPAGRFASAGELAEALRRYLGWGPRRWRQLRRRRREVLAATLGTAALAIGSGIYVSRLPPLEELLLARGMREYGSGQYEAAANTLAACLDIRSDWPAARFARGQALRMAGDPGGARTEFLALKDHDLAVARSLAGYCDLVLENTVAAEIDYELAEKFGAHDAVFWNNLGYCQRRQGKLTRSLSSLDRAISADPGLAVARCNRALTSFQVSLRAGQPVSEATLADIVTACRLAPDRADFHFHAGSIFAMARQSDPALQDDAVIHLQRAYKLGYPRASQKSVPPELVRLLPAELQTPDTGPNASKPAPLYASPSESPDLGGFTRS